MVQSLQSIHGGGDSIKVGTTGTIGTLMTRELDHMKHMPNTNSDRKVPPTVPVSVPCGAIPKKAIPKRNLANESTSTATTSSNSNSNNNNSSTGYKNPRNTQKKSDLQKNDHDVPMLSSRDIPTEQKPIVEKLDKKGSDIVEVVDLKCGNPDKAWSRPITTRLKKLGFSKLSETVA